MERGKTVLSGATENFVLFYSGTFSPRLSGDKSFSLLIICEGPSCRAVCLPLIAPYFIVNDIDLKVRRKGWFMVFSRWWARVFREIRSVITLMDTPPANDRRAKTRLLRRMESARRVRVTLNLVVTISLHYLTFGREVKGWCCSPFLALSGNYLTTGLFRMRFRSGAFSRTPLSDDRCAISCEVPRGWILHRATFLAGKIRIPLLM